MDMTDYEFDRGITDPDYIHHARSYLVMRGYADINILAITAHLRRFGTAECCPGLWSEEDRDMLGSFLPRSPEVRWLEHELFRWELGPETNLSAMLAIS